MPPQPLQPLQPPWQPLQPPWQPPRPPLRPPTTPPPSHPPPHPPPPSTRPCTSLVPPPHRDRVSRRAGHHATARCPCPESVRGLRPPPVSGAPNQAPACTTTPGDRGVAKDDEAPPARSPGALSPP